MIKPEFSEQTVIRVLGNHRRYGGYGRGTLGRTPLHIDLEAGQGDEFVQPAEVTWHDSEVFNAIGSRAKTRLSKKFHLPVIDTNGGAKLQDTRGSKVIINAQPGSIGEYRPDCVLKDILGDHGIDLEVHEEPVGSYRESLVTSSVHIPGEFVIGKKVTAIVLRSGKMNVFDVADSSQEGHSHIYVNQTFGDEDHRLLIEELGNIGIISPAWQEITEQAGMGIVTTPWAINTEAQQAA